jgi:carboxyl-terminal processing protease
MSRTSRSLIGILGIAVVGSTIAVATNAARDPYAFFDPIVEVRMLLDEHYVEKPDDDEMMIGAINGMIETLNDPYTQFVPNEDTAEFTKNLTGEYVGIGAEVGIRDGWFTILSPLDDSPAWRAGVMADDRVIAIDGESTEGKSIDESIDRLMGKPGTEVTVTVERAGSEPIDITILRQPIRVLPVKGLYRENEGEGAWHFTLDPELDIAYIRLSQFTPHCAEELRRAIDKATEENSGNLGGLILDLRFNPGGVMEQAVAIADMFLDDGVIVSTIDRDGRGRVDRASAAGTLPDFPMAVLVNAQSASASEIVAGALGEHDRAVIIGARTFGKGLVQSVRPLPSNAGVIKITEQRYALPSGRILQRTDDSETWGVDPTPGYYLPLTDEETAEMLTARRQQEIIAHRDGPAPASADEILASLSDPQLAAALGVLRHRIETGAYEPVGIPANDPSFVAAGALESVRRQRDRLLRDLVRLDRRLEAAERGTPENARADARDLWPDDTDVRGGTVTVTDAQGRTVATLTVTGPDLERWLVDAGVEPASGDQPNEQASGRAGEPAEPAAAPARND